MSVGEPIKVKDFKHMSLPHNMNYLVDNRNKLEGETTT